MKKRVVTYVVLLLCAVPCGVRAQFSLPDVSQTSELLNPLTTLGRPDSLRNEYFSYAAWKAERRAIRRQRNTLELSATLQMSQTQFENWASGGDNTFSGRSTVFFRHRYEISKFSLESKFEARYGINYIEGKRFKNEDEFRGSIQSAWAMHDNWSYAALGELRSQFSTGYKSRTDNTRVSTLMAPGFLKLSVGFKYSKSGLTAQISPVAGSATFMLDDELMTLGLNGVEKGQRSKWQVGPSLDIGYDKTFYKKVFRYRSNLQGFTNIKTAPTVRWENTFDIRATKFLTTTLYWLAAYDKYASTPRPDALQYKYSISVGLAYNFKNK